MLYVILLSLMGLIFIGYAVYVSFQIKKRGNSEKYGADPETVIITRGSIGIILIVAAVIGVIVINTKDVKPVIPNTAPDVASVSSQAGPKWRIAEPKEPKWKTTDNSIMAYVMMQEFVKDRLVSPASAKFPYGLRNNQDVTVKKNGDEYTIFGYVDSQNRFGAMLRTYYSGVIRQIDDKNWRLAALDFEDE